MGITAALSGFGIVIVILGILVGGAALFMAAKLLKTNLSFPQALIVNAVTVFVTFLPYGRLLALVAFFWTVKTIAKTSFGETFILLVLQAVIFIALFQVVNKCV